MMLIELSKSDYSWFRDFISNYIALTKTHVLNGNGMSDRLKENLYEVVSLKPQRSGVYLVPIDEEDLEFYLEILEENTCCCPGCTLPSVKHRKSVANKFWRLIQDDDEGL